MKYAALSHVAGWCSREAGGASSKEQQALGQALGRHKAGTRQAQGRH